MSSSAEGSGSKKRPSAEISDTTDTPKSVKCNKCETEFPTRNRLFAHIRSGSCTEEPNKASSQPELKGKRDGQEKSSRKGDYVFVVGGRNRAKTLGTVEKFNISEQRWETAPTLVDARGSHGVGVADGVIYAIGGGGIKSNLKTVERFDGKSKSWAAAPELNVSRHALSVSSFEGKIYCVAGWMDGTSCTGAVECFTKQSGKWVLCAPLLTPRRLFGVAAHVGAVYVFGGNVDDSWAPLKSAERYSEKENKWTSIANLPVPACSCACAVGDFIYVLLWGSSSALLRYDPAKDTYEKLSELPLPDWHGFAATSIGTEIYVLGGATKGQWSSDAFCYNVADGTWKKLPSMKAVRRRTAAVAVTMSGMD